MTTEELSQHSNKEAGSQPRNHEIDPAKENSLTLTQIKSSGINNDDERRKQIAARDTLARLVMQREEAMETEEGR